MRSTFAVQCAMAFSLVISAGTLRAQIPSELSKEPPSPEQVAVYRAFVRSYDRDFQLNLRSRGYAESAKAHISNRTTTFGPLELSACRNMKLA